MPTFNNVTIRNASCVFPPPDPYWNNVSLLLQFDYGGATTFVDSSSYNRSVTQAWGINTLATAPVKWPGTNAGSLAPSPIDPNSGENGSVLKFDNTRIGSTDAWTWETWFYRSRTGNYSGFLYNTAGGSGGDRIYLNTPNEGGTYQLIVRFSFYETLVGATSIPLNTWVHLAVSYESPGATLRIFVNGNLDAQRSGGPIFNTTSEYRIGQHVGSGFAGLLGYTDDMRLTGGVCRYTTSFTPPTGPFPNS